MIAYQTAVAIAHSTALNEIELLCRRLPVNGGKLVQRWAVEKCSALVVKGTSWVHDNLARRASQTGSSSGEGTGFAEVADGNEDAASGADGGALTASRFSASLQLVAAAFAGVLDRGSRKPSTKGEGLQQPDTPHRHWHMDIAYLNIAGTLSHMISVLEGYSRHLV
jgi:hypothetical protein